MNRREFLAAVAQLTALGVLRPWEALGSGGKKRTVTAPKDDLCPNCAMYPRRPDSRVCSPLCNFYQANRVIAYRGVREWDRLRLASIRFIEGAA